MYNQLQIIDTLICPFLLILTLIEKMHLVTVVISLAVYLERYSHFHTDSYSIQPSYHHRCIFFSNSQHHFCLLFLPSTSYSQVIFYHSFKQFIKLRPWQSQIDVNIIRDLMCSYQSGINLLLLKVNPF